MSFIELQQIGKVYQPERGGPPVRVLEQIDESIQEGEFICLMGPSGSGKSTLLTVVGAMNRPSEGRLLVDAIDVYSLADEARADFRREYLGFVFQQHHLMPYLSALENVMLPLATARLSAREKRQRAAAALEDVDLADKASRVPSQLSGGEQGRLAIARALVNEPPLILADEPTGALDSHTGREVMEIFLRLKRRGQTIFMVTHNPANAAMADRTIQIRDGRIHALAEINGVDNDGELQIVEVATD